MRSSSVTSTARSRGPPNPARTATSAPTDRWEDATGADWVTAAPDEGDAVRSVGYVERACDPLGFSRCWLIVAAVLAGGAGRLILGELSDRVNRRVAMAASFSICGLGLFAVVEFAKAGTTAAFLLSVVLATFFWSPQYTLFPSIVADYYGEARSSANYALLYSGKMWGGVFGGAVAGWAVTVVGWPATFRIGGLLAVGAGLAAVLLWSPAREPASSRTGAPASQD